MVRASPATSSTVSPLVLSPMRKPAISTSVASSSMIERSTSAASSALRSRPDATASIARVRMGLGKDLVEPGGAAGLRLVVETVLAGQPLTPHGEHVLPHATDVGSA